MLAWGDRVDRLISSTLQVREVQRLRQEDRRAQDATLSAVAADVSRLKFGQAELVKAHRQYQVCLAAIPVSQLMSKLLLLAW